MERANAGDVDGVTALYEPDAVVASAGGDLVNGAEAIRRMYEALLADPPQFAGDVRPALLRAISLSLQPGFPAAPLQRSRGARAMAPGCGSPITNVTG